MDPLQRRIHVSLEALEESESICYAVDLTFDNLSDTDNNWVFAGQAKYDESNIHPGGMAACVGSKITSYIFDVAKFATLVAVK